MTSDRWPSIADFLADWLGEPRLAPEQQAVLDRYYRDYRGHFGPYIRRHYASQTMEAMALLRDGARTVLEVGAGCGTEALWLALQGASVTSIDISEGRLEVARARQAITERETGRKLDLVFRNQPFLGLEAPERFDLVWMEQAFHHLEPRAQVYAAVARTLKPGGYAVISEANAWNPLLQTKLFLQRGFRTRIRRTLSDGTVQEYGNERITAPRALERGFRAVEIERVSLRYFRMFPNRPWAARLANLEEAVPRAFRPFLSTHYNFVGRKAVASSGARR